MKKEITLTERNEAYNDLSQLFNDAGTWLHAPAAWLRRYYSAILEREVSSRQASFITQAQLSFILAVFPIMPSALLHAACIGWFLVSLYKCRDI